MPSGEAVEHPTPPVTFVLPFVDLVGGAQVVGERLAQTLSAQGIAASCVGLRRSSKASPPAEGLTIRDEIGWFDTARGVRGLVTRRSEHRKRVKDLAEFVSLTPGVVVLSTSDVIELGIQARVQDLRPTIGHVHSALSAVAGLPQDSLTVRRGGAPVVEFVRWVWRRAIRGPYLYRHVLRVPERRLIRSLHQCDAVVVMSEQDAQTLQRAGIKRAICLPNPVPRPQQPPSRPGDRIVACVARLSGEKNLPLLIEAFSRLRSEFPDWRLEIWGEGPDRKRLESLISSLESPAPITLNGYTDDPESALRHAGVLALTSDTEGQPLVLMEAMMLGVPCISTESSPAVREILAPPEAGLVVPVRDVDALVRGLRKLMATHPDRTMSERAQSLAQRFATDAVASQWQDLLRSVGDSRPPGAPAAKG